MRNKGMVYVGSVPMLLALATGLVCAQTSEWTTTQPLPKPTGRYAIGTVSFQMMDTVLFPDGRRVARPVTAQAWYPARRGRQQKARYVEQRLLLDAMIREKYQDLPAAEIRPWAQLKLSASAGAAPASSPRGRGWPALIFSHGFGVSRVNYSALAQELASRGYVVLTVDHPYGGFMVAPDGRLLQPGGDSLRRGLGSPPALATVDSALAWDARRWALEGAAVVRRVAARRTGVGTLASLSIDTMRVGMLGHSLGGAAALQGCRDVAIFRTCADMDGAPVGDVERDGVPKPILVLLSQPAGSKSPPPRDSIERAQREDFARMSRERDSTWRAIPGRNPSIPAFMVKLPGTAHFTFSDAPFLMPSLLQGTGSTLSATRANGLVISYLTAFFDHFLRDAPVRLLTPGLTTVPLK
jgi:dienelactone hydrolase